jgi:hypothetical protein
MKVSFVSHNEIGKKVIVIVSDLQKSASKTEKYSHDFWQILYWHTLNTESIKSSPNYSNK